MSLFFKKAPFQYKIQGYVDHCGVIKYFKVMLNIRNFVSELLWRRRAGRGVIHAFFWTQGAKMAEYLASIFGTEKDK